MTRKPNFIFIGGPRCASKWLHRVFGQYNEVCVSQLADPNFFDREDIFARGYDWYLELFKHANDNHKIIAEFSHDYCFSQIAAERIKNYLPHVKLVLCVRHPVDRAISHFNFQNMIGNVPASLNEAIVKDSHIIDHSYFSKSLDVYLKIFDSNQLLILFYEDLEQDPESYVKKICNFLGISFDASIIYSEKYNQAAEAKNKFLGYLSGKAAQTLRFLGLANVLGQLKQSKFLFNLLYKNVEKKEKLVSEEEIKNLFKLYKEEVLLMKKLTGRDLKSDYSHLDT